MDDMDAMEVSDDDNIPERLPKFNCYSYYVKNRSLSRRSNRLLPQQKEALETLCQWFDPDSENKDKIALVSMPTGSGKTGIISCLPYFLGSIGLTKNESNTAVGHPNYPFKQPVLVIAPDLAISKQLEEQLSVSQSGSIDQPFLIRRGIVPVANKDVLPKAKKIESTAELKDRHPLETNELIIANAQKFLVNNWEDELPADMFRLVIVDEAHHHPARTWRRIVNKFKNKALVVFFTATPYRADRRPVLEDTTPAYHLSLKEAVKTGIIRQTNFQELKLIDPNFPQVYIRDLESKTDEEKKSLRRKMTILRKVKELMDLKNGTGANAQQLPGGIQHMGMAIAKNIDCADELLDLWKAMYPEYAAETYHSNLSQWLKKKIMDKLKNNELRLVIVVGMLLEGFDHPPISIAAITCKISSPVKFVQFVGRAQRICRGTNEIEKNGQAHIITHVDYEQRHLYDKFIEERFILDDPPEDQ